MRMQFLATLYYRLYPYLASATDLILELEMDIYISYNQNYSVSISYYTPFVHKRYAIVAAFLAAVLVISYIAT